MSNVTKLILVAVVTMVVTATVVATLSFVKDSSGALSSSIERVNGVISLNSTLENELTRGPLSGIDVRYYAGKLAADGVGTLIVNGATSTYSTEELKNASSNEFVNGTDVYYATVVKKNDDSLLGVEFVREGESFVEFDYDTAMKTLENVNLTMKNQLAVYEEYQKMKSGFGEWMLAINELSELVEKERVSLLEVEDANANSEQLTVSRKKDDYRTKGNIYKGYADFYSSLLGFLNKCLSNNYFGPLIYDVNYQDEETDAEDNEVIESEGESSGGGTEEEEEKDPFEDPFDEVAPTASEEPSMSGNDAEDGIGGSVKDESETPAPSPSEAPVVPSVTPGASGIPLATP